MTATEEIKLQIILRFIDYLFPSLMLENLSDENDNARTYVEEDETDDLLYSGINYQKNEEWMVLDNYIIWCWSNDDNREIIRKLLVNYLSEKYPVKN